MSIEISNAVWRTSQSAGRARLVLLAIADHQGEIGAWPSIKTLASMVNASERSVQRDIAELVELGELIVEVQQAPSRGQYKSNLYWVNLPSVANLISGVTEPISGVTDFDSGVTDFDSGVTELQSGVTELQSGVTESASGVTAGGVLTLIEPLLNPYLKTNDQMNDWEELTFDEFWALYPRKIGKGAAKKALLKLLRSPTTSVSEIIDGVTRLAFDRNLPEVRFIPHPATWLNEERWQDDPYPPQTKANHKQQQREEAASKFLQSFNQPAEITTNPDWA